MSLRIRYFELSELLSSVQNALVECLKQKSLGGDQNYAENCRRTGRTLHVSCLRK